MMEYLGYGFVLRGALAGVCVAAVCAMLGVVLVLRRLSLIGDGLAHVTFFGVAAGLALRAQPLAVALPVAMAGSFGVMKMAERARVYGDAAIGMVSAAGVAGGVLLVSLGGGFNVDIFNYLFGNILAISPAEMWLSVLLSAGVTLAMGHYYREFMSVSFDEDFARVSGVDTARINTVLALLTAVAVVLAINVVGMLLTSSLIIIPAVTAARIARGFGAALFIAAFLASGSVLCGMAIALPLNLPAGATIVMLNLAVFFLVAALCRPTVKKAF